MMWTRKELKERAKEALKRNYWRVVLVALIAMLIGGGTGGAFTYKFNDDNFNQGFKEGVAAGYQEVQGEDADIDIVMKNVSDNMFAELVEQEPIILVVYVIVFIVVFLIILAIGITIDVLIINPLLVGVGRFMLKSVDDTARVSEISYTFDHNYKNGIKTMFMKDLFIALWSLLFVIPGIYKAYQYRMVAYILAEHPDMPYTEVLQMSKDMMNGQKWNAFVLDLSFILWHILGGITCGIVEIFYVAPYVQLTDAALYRKLTQQNPVDVEILQ